VLNPTSHPKATPYPAFEAHLKPFECLQCKVEADSDEKQGGLRENVGLVLGKNVGLDLAHL
jgi:hypothetical protein